MKLEHFSFTRRKPEEKFGHMEVTLSGTFEEGDNPDKVLEITKHHAHKSLGIKDSLHIDTVKEVGEGGMIETENGNKLDPADTEIEKSKEKKVSKTTTTKKKKTSKASSKKKTETKKDDKSKESESKTEEKEAENKAESESKGEEVVTLDVLKDKAKQVYKKRGKEVYLKIMEELGKTKTDQLEESEYPKAFSKFEKALG